MKNQLFRNIATGILISSVTLVAGFFAVTLPFRLFDELSTGQLRALFAGELIIYFLIICTVCLKAESKKEKRKRKKFLSTKKETDAAQPNHGDSQIKHYDFAA